MYHTENIFALCIIMVLYVEARAERYIAVVDEVCQHAAAVPSTGTTTICSLGTFAHMFPEYVLLYYIIPHVRHACTRQHTHLRL